MHLETNYAGALIFWAYIAAALYCTGVVLHTIHSAGGFQSHGKHGNPKVPLFLILLALSSFSTLSYHMLNVLILSYKQWASFHNIALPSGIFGPGSLLGPTRTPLHLWQWSTTSSLFQDFGEAIVATKARYFLSSAGLWSTVAVSTYMGIQGTKPFCINPNTTNPDVKGRKTKIPNLWAFFALLEILPTSFAQTLFYMMLSVQPRPAGSPHRLLSYWPLWALLSLFYNICLGVAPQYAGLGSWLVYVILAARLLLILPLFLPLSNEAPGTGTSVFKHAASLYQFIFILALQFLWMRVGGVGEGEPVSTALLGALDSHPAVKTLSYDLLHSVIAFGYWGMWRNRAQSVQGVPAEARKD